MNSLRKNREIPAIYRRIAIHAGALFALAASQVAGAQRSSGPDVDNAVLSAILKAAASDAGRGDLRVDPRPLIVDAALYSVQPEAMAHASPVVVRRRTAVINAAGFKTVDTTIVNQSRNCPGSLVTRPLDSLGRVDDKRVVGCPEKPFAVIAVGPLRPGSAVLPQDQVYDRDTETAARGYWAARVIRTTLGRGRSRAYAADYVLAKRAGTWVVIKIVGLMNVE